ncbi:LysR family transcriptional regulator [Pseudoalteromonas denitrificans]|uniref:Transcriptional regulator, LysR family n=1 Tax=Pseudoalteromonas denitrificans DSM 6059 TaxID=1123010 RepID=A0A1I1N535_9GAMM|nr:LysR family transcriptional regulator [Pseudoalteromonas denitrificans]SFC92729.1 transcriptional regulator, LysR family [Pseudoalteromonas denitrificans DSM 6059]
MTLNTKLFDGVVVFNQVVESGGFSAAANVSGHSTSYISKEINKLEARLGVRLLNRTTRSISLTPEGKEFNIQCQQLILDAQQAQGILNQSHILPKGILKISCPIGFGSAYLKPVLAEYLNRYPDVTLDLDFSDRHVDVIQDGYDLVIRATTNLTDSSLICKKLKTFKAYTVTSFDYIKRFGKPTKPEELTNHQCMCYANHKIPTRWSYKSLTGETISVDVPQTILSNNAEMQLAMVIAGNGICRLPEFYMQKELAENKLEILFQEYESQLVEVYALYPSRKHLSPKVRCLIDLLMEIIPQ